MEGISTNTRFMHVAFIRTIQPVFGSARATDTTHTIFKVLHRCLTNVPHAGVGVWVMCVCGGYRCAGVQGGGVYFVVRQRHGVFIIECTPTRVARGTGHEARGTGHGAICWLIGSCGDIMNGCAPHTFSF